MSGAEERFLKIWKRDLKIFDRALMAKIHELGSLSDLRNVWSYREGSRPEGINGCCVKNKCNRSKVVPVS